MFTEKQVHKTETECEMINALAPWLWHPQYRDWRAHSWMKEKKIDGNSKIDFLSSPAKHDFVANT